MDDLKGKVVLITGASSGIGAATALAFAALQALQIAELKTLTIGQQENFAHRMAELVRAYLTGGKK